MHTHKTSNACGQARAGRTVEHAATNAAAVANVFKKLVAIYRGNLRRCTNTRREGHGRWGLESRGPTARCEEPFRDGYGQRESALRCGPILLRWGTMRCKYNTGGPESFRRVQAQAQRRSVEPRRARSDIGDARYRMRPDAYAIGGTFGCGDAPNCVYCSSRSSPMLMYAPWLPTLSQ